MPNNFIQDQGGRWIVTLYRHVDAEQGGELGHRRKLRKLSTNARTHTRLSDDQGLGF